MKQDGKKLPGWLHFPIFDELLRKLSIDVDMCASRMFPGRLRVKDRYLCRCSLKAQGSEFLSQAEESQASDVLSSG